MVLGLLLKGMWNGVNLFVKWLIGKFGIVEYLIVGIVGVFLFYWL